MVSEAKRKSIVKWDKANLTTVGCRITRKRAAEFKEACSHLGKTQNSVFLEAIQKTIDDAKEKGE